MINLSVDVICRLFIKIIMINLSICQLYVGNQNNSVMSLSVDASYMSVIKSKPICWMGINSELHVDPKVWNTYVNT